jgi:Uncharacterised nucleotidyltransferase
MIVGSPEVELILCCARTRPDSESAARIEALLQQRLDWRRLLQIAHEHGMVPLLYWHLNGTLPEAVPEAVLNDLREHFRVNGLRNLALTAELRRILTVLESRGIPVIPYKGPVLAASAYGNLTLREFVDLDVLVHKQDIPRAKELLASIGYQQQDLLTPTQERAFLHSDCEYHFAPGGENRDLVELHWRITPRTFSFLLDPESLWGRLERISLGGAAVPTLSPEDLLLILCAHGCAEFWRQLKLICDVAELIRVREAMDWDELVRRASALGCRRMLLLGLFLANDVLGAEPPTEVMKRVRRDPAVVGLADGVYGWLFRGALLPRGFSQSSEDNTFSRFHVEIRERLRDKVRYCARVAFTPNEGDWNGLQLPPALWPLYYAVRPIRLVGKYGSRLIDRRAL